MSEETRAKWLKKLKQINKESRRAIIFAAYEEGGLTYPEIAEALGDFGRQQVGKIVREERAKRES